MTAFLTIFVLQWNVDNLFVKSRDRYIEKLDITNLRENEQNVPHIGV